MGKQPTKVDKIPQGYEFSHKDTVTGRDIYKKASALPGGESKPKPPKPKTNTGTSTPSTNVLKKPLPRKTPPTVQEDFVYMEPTTPAVPTNTAPVIPKMPLYEDTRIDRKLQPPINPNIDFYQYPDPNAGYSKSTPMYFDKTTQRPVDISKSIGADGNYVPVYTDTLKLNEGKYQGTTKQGNPRVTTEPEKTIILPGNEIDKSGTKKGEIIGTTGFAKGGLVKKIKGYALGGTTGFNEFSSVNSGVVGQSDPYAAKRAEDKKKTETEKNNRQNEQNRQNLGSVMGGYSKSYLASAPNTGSQDSATKTAMGTVSDMGAIGGVVGGAYGIVDSMARPEKNKAEAMDITYDSQGNATAKLKSSAAAKDTAIAGSLLSPSEALSTRMSYEGGMTDISGDAYTRYLEKQAQDQLDVYNRANKTDKQNQAVAAREAGNLNASINPNLYNLRGASFNDSKQLEGVKSYVKGGLVSGVKQMCAKGGVIKGKGGPKDDKINAKVEADSFVVPADNAKVAETLRAALLRKAPKAPANLNQKNGEKVKLSNGEHLFTPEEKHELMEKGVDVNALAPDAEHKEEMVEKKSHIMFPKFAKGGGVPNESDWNKMYSDKKNYKPYKTYEELIKPPNNWTGTKEAWKAAADKAIAEGKVTPYTGNKGKAPTDSDYAKMYGAKKETSSTQKPALKAPSVKKSTSKSAPDNLPSKDIALQGLNQDAELKANNQLIKDEASILASPTKQDAIVAATKNSNDNYVASNPKSKSSGILSKIGNIDPTSVVGIGQVIAGKDMLSKEVRPTYNATLDQTYNANVDRALKEATYGLTPEQRIMAEQDIENAKRDAMKQGVNYAGGSGTQAFNLNRAAINDAWKNKLGLKQADTEMRMNKQMYADQQAANRASIIAQNKRRSFEDAMGTFQQRQQAGSELISAGLANTIGAYRYNKDLQAQKEANLASNEWTRQYGQTNV